MLADNPFFHRAAIRQAKDFHGRVREIRQIMGLLRNGQSVSLIGPRRIGKSSLLLHLVREETRKPFGLGSPQMLFILLDCQELGMSSADEVYETLAMGLLQSAENAGISLPTLPQSDNYRSLDRALNHLTRQNSQVVFMLDEFELLAVNESLSPHFFARLRGLTTKYGVAYLTASQRPLFDITSDEKILSSPFFNIFVTMPIGLYIAEEAESLLTKRLSDNVVTFSPELQAHLLYLVGPHPFFLHIAGYHAFQALQNGESLAESAKIDEPIEVEVESHLAYLWQNLTPSEQHALAIADGVLDHLRLLEQQCLLLLTEDGYGYTSEILRRFVRRQEVAGLIQAEPFVIDSQRYKIWANGKEFNLTTSQFSLFSCLCRFVGQVVTSDNLERVVWGEALVDDPDRLKTMIKRLRRAIEPYGNWIVSERGVGYALRAPE